MVDKLLDDHICAEIADILMKMVSGLAAPRVVIRQTPSSLIYASSISSNDMACAHATTGCARREC